MMMNQDSDYYDDYDNDGYDAGADRASSSDESLHII